jgi:23S rRNA (cytidine1920-2'-O)/16S rRNA (cytidine1409-2'-O)-methyltransferase
MERLDSVCFNLGFATSRTRCKNLILEGRVSVDGVIITKPSFLVDDGSKITVETPEKDYVSRGAFKLLHALDNFNINVENAFAVDIGASTGGFSQVLLERGVSLIYAVDVGKGQLHPEIKSNSKVISMEETNARELDENSFNHPINLVVMDVSFISQTLIYPAISRFLVKGGTFVSLVKPQFEAGRENIGKGGIVKDKRVYDKVKEKIISMGKQYNLNLEGYIPSPIEGGDGNKEFLAFFRYCK